MRDVNENPLGIFPFIFRGWFSDKVPLMIPSGKSEKAKEKKKGEKDEVKRFSVRFAHWGEDPSRNLYYFKSYPF